MKLLTVVDTPGIFQFYCPGCKNHHGIYTKEFPHEGPKWEFNGDMDKPTFSPSLRIQNHYGIENKLRMCHSFIRNGSIEFLSDCTHELAGQTVIMEEV